MINNYQKKSEILAKSESQISLDQHIKDCLNILKQLCGCFPRLSLLMKEEEFWRTLSKCIIFHDTGKAHEDFQKKLYQQSNSWNNQRHEIFSLYFIEQSNLLDEIKDFVRYAVIGHHKCISEIYDFIDHNYNTSSFPIGWYSCKTSSFAEDCKKLQTDEVWKILECYNIKKTNDKIADIVLLAKRFKEPYQLNDDNFLLMLLLVGFLKQCDHLASAGIDKLYKLQIGDEATVSYNANKYNYRLTNIYNQAKTGTVAIYRNPSVKTLTLITCTHNDDYNQTIYIFEEI